MAFFTNDVWRHIFKFKILQYKGKWNSLSTDSLLSIYSRKSSIPLCFRTQVVNIHKGSVFRKLELSKYNIYSKFGEYAYTRKLYYYPLKKKNRR